MVSWKKYLLIALIVCITLLVWGLLAWAWNIFDSIRLGAPWAGSSEPRIGIISPSEMFAASVTGFKDGLTAAGYRPGEDIVYLERRTKSDADSINQAIKELESKRIDIIYALSMPAAEAAMAAGSRVPFVFNLVGDPQTAGLIKDYSSSATNFTGCTHLTVELAAKRLEMFKTAFPRLNRVALLANADDPTAAYTAANVRRAAGILRLEIVPVEFDDAPGLHKVLADMPAGVYDGIYIAPDIVILENIEPIVSRADALGLPTMGHEEALARKGASLTYGADFYELGRVCSDLAVNLLKGRAPREIPIRTPERFELVVNAAAARGIGLEPSEEILRLADIIIE